MISKSDAGYILNRIQYKLWEHDGYLGYAEAMRIAEEEINKSICKHCSLNLNKTNEDNPKSI